MDYSSLYHCLTFSGSSFRAGRVVLINLVFTKVDLSRYVAIKNRIVGISDLENLYTEDLFTELMGFICQRYA